MDFVKRQWRLLLVGVACLAALGISVWQFLAAGSVAEAMQKPVSVGKDLLASSKQLYNVQWIEQKRKENEANEARYSKALDELRRRQLYNLFDGPNVLRKPLVEEALPAPTRTQPCLDFRNRYRTAFNRLATRLRAGAAPTDLELNEAVERFAQRRKAELDLLASPWGIGKPGDAGNVGATDALDRVRRLWQDPKVRYSLERATPIYMYLDSGAIRPQEMATKDMVPGPVEIWYAQMSLWIQQDLVLAMAAVNDAEVRRLQGDGHPEQCWVAYLPVKHLRMMSIGALGGRGGSSNAAEGALRYPNFTRRGNNDKYFVVPLRLSLVMETSAIPRLIDALCEVSFITPVEVNYSEVAPNWSQVGCVYGAAPVAQVDLYLEGYYLHSVYGPFMPPAIKAVLSQGGGGEGQG